MIMCVLLCYPVSIRIYYQQGGLFLVQLASVNFDTAPTVMNSFQLIITYLKFSIPFVFEYPFYIDCLFTIYAVALHLFVVPSEPTSPPPPPPPPGFPPPTSGTSSYIE